CALACRPGWRGFDLVGTPPPAAPGGRRAGYVAHWLQLAGRDDIPVAAGAEVSLTTLRSTGVVIDDERHWPATMAPRPAPPGAALDLLDRSIERERPWWPLGPTPTWRCWRSPGPAALAASRWWRWGMDGATCRRPACLGTGEGPQRAVRHPGGADSGCHRHQADPGHASSDPQGAPARR